MNALHRRRSLLLSLVPLPLAPTWAQPTPPRENLLVELRWVESGVSGAALDTARQGGTVLGTAGSLGTRPGGTTLSTRRADAGIEQGSHQLLVLNGHAASVMLSETELLQWLDYEIEPRERAGSGGRPRVNAQLRSQPVERRRGFALTPLWPGGRAPVRVELRALAPAAGGDAEIFSTVQAPLGDWVTVARRGAALRAPQPGVLSSEDAAAQTQRELQIRISPAP